MDDKVKIVLNSNYRNSQYRMYEDKIIVKRNDEETYIGIPKIDRGIGFYDMYYANGCINVIVATRGNYDIRYVLDEERLKLVNEQLSK